MLNAFACTFSIVMEKIYASRFETSARKSRRVAAAVVVVVVLPIDQLVVQDGRGLV